MKPGLLLFAIAGCSGSQDVISARQLPAAIQPDAATVVAANNQFACDIYGTLAPGNALFSPFSISTAFAMLDAGAANETDAQLRTALHFTLPGDQLHAAYGALLTSIDTGRSFGSYTLATADRLFGQMGFPFVQSYLDITKTDYEAQLMPLDFESDPEASRGTINQWVASQTDNKIPTLFPDGSIDSSTRLALANAILFKGTWDTQFDPSKTSMEPFHVSGGSDISVPIMHSHETIAMASIPGGELGVFAFQGKDLAMVVLLPSDQDGLAALEAQLTGPLLAQWIASAQPVGPLDVALPKFQLTEAFGLNQALEGLGATDAFDPTLADFSGIDGGRDLYVQAALHQATITVDEQGAEAAAATGIGLGETAEGPELIVNHSFVFLIFDQVTGSVLFMGRAQDPSLTQ
jgi:serine protease inhibitor